MTEAHDAPSDVGEAIHSFIDYRKTVHDVLSDLKALRTHALTLGLHATAEQMEEMIRRMDSDRFSIAIVGEFKRGKSTFINALLGADILPTDVLPCSATLNRVTYGLNKHVVIDFKDGKTQTVPYDKLSDYVTKLTDESEELARSIASATVHYPSPYCQNSVDVIDTPGLNDDESMTDVTLSVLPNVDAAILVIRAQSPFSEYERRFLETRLFSTDLGRVIFVVNGIDQLNSPQEADRIIEAVTTRIAKNVLARAKREFGEDSPEYQRYTQKVGNLRVHGLSAFEALHGKLENSAERLERSRFPTFEYELMRFLTEGRGAIRLQVPLNRIVSGASELSSAISTQKSALGLKSEEFEQAAANSEAKVAELRESKNQELAKLQQASNMLQAQVGKLADQFSNELRNGVQQLLDNAEISKSDISGSEAKRQFEQKIGADLGVTISTLLNRYNSQLQDQVEQALAYETERLADFDVAVSGLMASIAERFAGTASQSKEARRAGDTPIAMLTAFTGWGGLLSGYRSAGWKGASVGAATHFGITITALMLGAPVTLPVFAVLGVASFFSGRYVSDSLFSKRRVENFREQVRNAAMAHLEAEMPPEKVREEFQQTAAQAVTMFRNRLEANAEAVLQDASATLTKLREEYARGLTRTEVEVGNFEQMHEANQKIAERAAQVSKQLVRYLENT